MTRTMGDLDKTRLEIPECDFSGALRKKTRFSLHGEFTIEYNF